MNEKAQKVKASNELIGKLVSANMKTSLIFGHMKPYFTGHPNHSKIHNQVKKIIHKYKNEKLFKFYLSGSVPIAAVGKKISMEDISLYSPLFILIIMFLLFVYFRSLAGIVIPLAVITLTLITTFGLMGYLDLKFNMLTFITPLALMAIAIADSIHFISSYYRIRENHDTKTSLQRAFNKNFYPTMVTSLTTAFGFFSLSTVELIPIRTLGLVSGLGTLLAWVYSVIIIIPLLSYLSHKSVKSNKLQLSKAKIDTIVDLLFEKRWKIMSIFTILLITAITLTSKTSVNFNFFKSLNSDVPVTQANTFLLKNFGGVAGPEIVLNSGKPNGAKNPLFLKKVELLSNWIITKKEVNSVSSMLDVIKKMNRVINNNKSEYFTIPKKQETVAELLFLYTMGLSEGTNINHMISLDQQKLRMTILWDVQDAVESKILMTPVFSESKELHGQALQHLNRHEQP